MGRAPTQKIRLPDLHPGQRDVWFSPARFRVVDAGRRWRKSSLGALACVVAALKGKRAWWVAPTYPVASIGWRMICQLAKTYPGIVKSASEMRLTFPGGGWVQVKSGDNPDSLRGEGLDLVVLDECAFMAEEVWTASLRPALSDRKGKAIFISTPKGHNWFWRIYQQGLAGGEWQSWKFPTASNPHIDKAEIEAARASLPERVFAQEYLAEFTEDSGGVFRKVIEAATVLPTKVPDDTHQYAFGVDWGKSNDWTVITVLDMTTKRMLALDRFNMIDYTLQKTRLRAAYEHWRPSTIIAERNSMGEPLLEDLQRMNLPVQGFLTTNATKAQIIEALALAFERGEIGIPNDPILLAELQAYEMDRLPGGTFRYGAPSGMHDDCVMSLALAWSAVANSGPILLWGRDE
jgi:hypothetical protein